MEVASPGQGVNGHAPSSATLSIIDPDSVVRHLVDLLEVTLGASTGDLEGPGSLLSDAKRQDTVQRCTRFASESQVSLYVQKDLASAKIPPGVLNGHTHPGMPNLDRVFKGPGSRALLRICAPSYLLAFFGNIYLFQYPCLRSTHQTSTAY